MKENELYAFEVLIAFCWNVFVLAGSVFLVVKCDWSKWTVLLALIVCLMPKRDCLDRMDPPDEKDVENEQ